METDIKFPNKLNPAIWDKDEMMKDSVRKKLNLIADRFSNSFDIELEVSDIVVTGSNANYNWNKSSDIDLHLIVEFEDTPDDKYKKVIADKERKLWNLTHNIAINDFEVEVYIEDKSEFHASSGVYSIIEDKWIKKPTKFAQLSVEKISYVKSKYIKYKNKIKAFANAFEAGNKSNVKIYNRTKKFASEMKDKRKNALESGGETSIFNLVYKKLRSNGYIDLLYKTMNDSYDKALSIN